MTLTDQKKQALELYVNQSFTQQQIANALGVCVRTVHNWVKQHAWSPFCLASQHASAKITSNFSSQLVVMQYNIAQRELGYSFSLTQKEEIMRKFMIYLNEAKKTVFLSQVAQMTCIFHSFVFDNSKKEYAHLRQVLSSLFNANSGSDLLLYRTYIQNCIFCEIKN